MPQAADQRGENEGQQGGDHEWLDELPPQYQESNYQACDDEPVGQSAEAAGIRAGRPKDQPRHANSKCERIARNRLDPARL